MEKQQVYLFLLGGGWSWNMQHSCLSAHTDRTTGNQQGGENLFPGMKCDFVQVFGCAPGAWWDVAAFQALNSPSFTLQLHPREQSPAGVWGGVLGSVEGRECLGSSPAPCSDSRTCRAARAAAEAPRGLPLPAGICLGALCPPEFQVLGQNWP